MSDVVELYRDKEGTYRWRRIASNGEPVSASGEGYKSKSYVKDRARLLNPGIRVEDLTEEDAA